MARVGPTKDEARREHNHARACRYRRPFAGVDRAIADGETNGFVGMGRRGRSLGGHVIGAGDRMQ